MRELYLYLRTIYFNKTGKFIYKPISILVPAHNEATTITSSIRALLSVNYPEYEIIIINDGSDDETLTNLIDEFAMVKFDKIPNKMITTKKVTAIYRSIDFPHLYIIDKEHGGKADALNSAINYAYYPLICSIDADSILDEDALIRASRNFAENSSLVALGGIVRVLNGSEVESGKINRLTLPRRSVERFQIVEYIRGFLTGRIAWNAFGSLLIISGAFSIFKKEAVVEVGGYRGDSVTEDMDLIVRLHHHFRENKQPYRIMFVPDPICWTQVPANWTSLLRQRNRWQRGLIETLWRNRRMFFNPKYGEVGLVGFPYFVFFEALGPIIEMIGYASVIALFFFGELSTNFAILFFFIAILYGAFLSMGSILLENFLFRRYERAGDFLKLVIYSLVEYFGYRQIITVERTLAIAQRNQKDWGKAKRQSI